MKTALQKAQEEYKQRLSDPSYVAPDILRSKNRKRVSENPEPSKEELQNWNDLKDKFFKDESDPDSAVREDEVDLVPLDEIQENEYLVKLEMLKKKIRGD